MSGAGEIEAIVETAIYVDDLDRAEAFYRDVLGLEVIGREAGRHVFFRVAPGVSDPEPDRSQVAGSALLVVLVLLLFREDLAAGR